MMNPLKDRVLEEGGFASEERQKKYETMNNQEKIEALEARLEQKFMIVGKWLAKIERDNISIAKSAHKLAEVVVGLAAKDEESFKLVNERLVELEKKQVSEKK